MAALKLRDGVVVFDPGWMADLTKQVRPLMERIGEVAERLAPTFVPVETGQVARSIEHTVDDDGALVLYATQWDAPFSEFGAGHRGAVTAEVAGWPGGVPFDHSDTPHTRPATPFLRPAMLAALRQVVR